MRSVNKNDRDSVDEMNYLNENELFLNDIITSKVPCREKSIPPATLAATSLHWLSQMKIPLHAVQVPHKNTVLRYLETVLRYSTRKENPVIVVVRFQPI